MYLGKWKNPNIKSIHHSLVADGGDKLAAKHLLGKPPKLMRNSVQPLKFCDLCWLQQRVILVCTCNKGRKRLELRGTRDS